jgi:long-chain acyl-CoA synthetase
VNLAALIESHPGDSVALIDQGNQITYDQLRHQVGQTRAGLTALGLERGDRVAIVAGTNTRFVVFYLAVLGAGFVAVPMNPLSPSPELASEIAAVTPRAMVVGPTGVPSVSGLSADVLASVDHILTPRASDIEGSISLASFEEVPPVVDVTQSDLALLKFTSGTAGSPKPAMLTHANLLANLDQGFAHPSGQLTADDVSLCVVPLSHILGLNAILAPVLRAGATAVLVERFDPTTVFELAQQHKITVMSGPPTLWSALAATPFDGQPLATIRRAFSGAAALNPMVRQSVYELHGLNIIEGYGLTETSSVLALGTEETPAGSVGRPLPGVRLRLVDAHGGDVYIGDEGEVWASGPNIFGGYWGNEEATAKALDSDGWLHTGDLAVVDDYGQLRLVDRVKDLIIVSGFNVFPAEVEDILVQHPEISEAGVVGIPHPHHGEAVRAYVVPVPNANLEADDVIWFCEQHLASYKCPGSVIIIDQIPRTSTGKIMRRSLG